MDYHFPPYEMSAEELTIFNDVRARARFDVTQTAIERVDDHYNGDHGEDTAVGVDGVICGMMESLGMQLGSRIDANSHMDDAAKLEVVRDAMLQTIWIVGTASNVGPDELLMSVIPTLGHA